MDGTLTVSMHDFDAMRAELGLPEGEPILEALDRLDRTDPVAGAAKRAALDAMELRMAGEATEQPGARAVLRALLDGGRRIGILTRNGREIADATLAAAGLDDLFESDYILGRECAAPKPDPAGVHLLLERWGANAHDAVMVGDGRFDLEAAAAAGCVTVHFDPDADPDEPLAWPEVTRRRVGSLEELLRPEPFVGPA